MNCSLASLGVALLVALAGPAVAAPAAKDLFGARTQPAAMASRSIGFYSKGCLAGAVGMPKDGPTWQMTRPSRNRAWGNPAMIALLERLSAEAAEKDGWRGFLIGDIAQPRGGPMSSGHASHQIGLDADVYLTPMPQRRLSDDERDGLDPQSLVDPKTLHVDDSLWRPEHLRLLRRVASEPEVQRVFVHPGIKQKLCQTAGQDRAWLAKVRPTYGHDYHFHIRMFCPAGESACEKQAAVGRDDGCDDLDWWFDVALQPPPPNAPPYKPKPPLTMADLPRACAAVLDAGGGVAPSAAMSGPIAIPTQRPSR
ncbi:penicillin-insensitive murein endopeptidase [Aureimonas altamirensis]|uniref:penicillin-insensitive murein endopeptidase n=1 Tax=Aureimonas altamirensis TaxID=370622 RepID=UPI001E64BCB6|nr:penicillin-insensitive murein endopeptidase [Aureimonas altamirensis]UHD45618.1 penicillin-insensitive murein endopeptidase [Aureimonas altamirensis]